MMSNLPIAIYGAGGNGQKIYHALSEHGIKIEFFVDLYTQETEYQGCPIYKPDNIANKNVTMLVSVSCTSEAIKQDLIGIGVQECLNMNEIINSYPYVLERFISKDYRAKLISSTQNDKEQLAWLKERLSDDESKKCLDDIIAFRSSPSSESYVENDWQIQYFPPWLLKLPLWKNGINFIDCGSYIGDTLASAAQVLKEAGIQLNTMQCFEPDPKNFHLLNKTAKELVSQGIKTYLFPCGVWEENTILSFSADLSQGKFADSQQIKDNNQLLPVIALDDTSIASAVNFIKMDIEGAEPHALKGAKEIITHQSPLLAISVYHETAHIWQIAQQIESYNPNYEYKLHCHGDFGLEIILYAIPKT